MKTIILAALMFTIPAFAQQIVSPDVSTDGRVTFRLWAPRATAVQVHCQDVSNPAMQKDEHGIWTLTTDPLAPDIYDYSFDVDGVHVTDPSNPMLKYNLLNTENQVHVPGPLSLSWEINDVPHGVLHHHFYHSAVAGDDRDFIVYTPPGYKASSWKRYPVLYLLHGYSDDASAWSTAGRANTILDNLIARGQAKPMIVVMPLGYGTMDIVRNGWSRIQEPGLWQKNVDKFTEAMLNEVMPQVENLYRASKDRRAHAIAGLSMGGTESLVTGLNHLDRFAWVGAFSSGGLSTNYVVQFPALDSSANDKLRLLWIACGKDDHLLQDNQKFCDWLTSKDIRYTWTESAGAHTYLVWRRDLTEFAPLLFQDK
ncbi:MAG: alpha/beta hydrolase-fold protein [Verrucomicrobiota bacterium]|jgi:enterochelin esterase family protein